MYETGTRYRDLPQVNLCLILRLLISAKGSSLQQQYPSVLTKRNRLLAILITDQDRWLEAGLIHLGTPMVDLTKAPLHPIPSRNYIQRIPRTGNRYTVTVQCSFTKLAEAYAVPNQRATTCIHSEQGKNFESQVFAEHHHKLG